MNNKLLITILAVTIIGIFMLLYRIDDDLAFIGAVGFIGFMFVGFIWNLMKKEYQG